MGEGEEEGEGEGEGAHLDAASFLVKNIINDHPIEFALYAPFP